MSRKVKYPRLVEMPYYKTKVSAHNTKVQIVSMLEKYGIQDHQWTTLDGKETVKFLVHMVVQGTELKKTVQFEIPQIKALYGSKNQLIDVPKSQSYRIFYHALKSVLESTKYGVLKLEHVLLSYTLTQLPSGETVQIKDLLEEHPLLLQTGFGSK